MNIAQDWVDNVFTYGSKGLANMDQNLEQTLQNVPAVSTPVELRQFDRAMQSVDERFEDSIQGSQTDAIVPVRPQPEQEDL